jgi:hypothetical protein
MRVQYALPRDWCFWGRKTTPQIRTADTKTSRFIVRTDEKLTAFLELESAIRVARSGTTTAADPEIGSTLLFMSQ